jgi:long-subunit fatty acid transport protein
MNVGALFKPTEKIQVGVVYKTPFSLDHSFDYTRNEISEDGEVTYEAHESGTIDFPATFGLGFAFRPKEQWTITTDYVRTSWSSAEYNFQEVETVTYPGITVEREETGSVLWPSYHDPSEPVSGLNRKQQDSSQIRFGSEYVLRWKTEIPLRAGFFTNRQLLTDATGGDVTFLGWSIGTGVYWSKVLVDVAFVHEGGGFRGQDFNEVTPDFRYSLIASNDDKISSNTFYVSTRFRL